MAIILWASVRSMVRLSLGGYDGLYGYSSPTAGGSGAALTDLDLTGPRTIPGRL